MDSNKEQRIKEYNDFLIDAEYIHYETEADKYRGKPYEDGVYKEYNESSFVINQKYDSNTAEGLNKILELSAMRINEMIAKGYKPSGTSQEEALKLLARQRARNYIRARILKIKEDAILPVNELFNKYDINTTDGRDHIIIASDPKLKTAIANNTLEEYIEDSIKKYKKP